MPPSPDPLEGAAAWVGALWGLPAQVSRLPVAAAPGGGPRRPVLAGRAEGERVLHLPTAPGSARPGWLAAAGAHAAAHWRHGGPPQPRAGLRPIQLALAGALEDARVEALALRELPGLRGLWLPFHQDGLPQGLHVGALLARLSLVLLDPGTVDPHPWVVRVRTLVGSRVHDLSPADVRRLASSLGHEVGQMRLRYDPAAEPVHAAYRDDNHHLWDPDPRLPPPDQPLPAGAAGDGGTGSPPAAELPPDRVRLHPEWDHRIGRCRPEWVRVVERDAPAAAGLPPPDGSLRQLARQVERALRFGGAASVRRVAGRSAWGDEFEAAALVDAGVRRRLREPADDRPYRGWARPAARPVVLLLVDASASTAAADATATVLDRLLAVAGAAAQALDGAGHRCAVLAFRSDGRQQVDLLHLKHWHEPALSPAVRQRMAALRPGGSTRTGAAVRHAAQLLAAAGPAGTRRRLVLLGDGEPHDVDVPHPRYLLHDLRHATAEAGRAGIDVQAVPLVLALRPRRPATLARLLVG